jgi:hypothetical protein
MRYKPSGSEADYEPGALGESDSDAPEPPRIKRIPEDDESTDRLAKHSKRRKIDEKTMLDAPPKKVEVKDASSVADGRNKNPDKHTDKKRDKAEKGSKDEKDRKEKAKHEDKPREKRKKDKHKDKEEKHKDKDKHRKKHDKEPRDNKDKKVKGKKHDKSSSKDKVKQGDEKN